MDIQIDNKKMWESILSLAAIPKEQHVFIETALADQGLRWNGKEIVRIEAESKIEAGRWYVCIKNLDDSYGTRAFGKGKVYHSEKDGTLMPDNSNIPFEILYCVNDYFRPATEEEIKGNNSKITPKFKVGDIIRLKGGKFEYKIFEITEKGYRVKFCCEIDFLPFKDEMDWELVEPKQESSDGELTEFEYCMLDFHNHKGFDGSTGDDGMDCLKHYSKQLLSIARKQIESECRLGITNKK